MFEYFFQRIADAAIFGLSNLVSYKTIAYIWRNREEDIMEYFENNILLKRQLDLSVIPELPEPRWIKVGKVTNLYIYPLISGKACDADECQITFDETFMYRKGQLITWDRSFVVYDGKTNCIMTIKQFPQLLKVSLSFKDKYITLQTDSMSTLCVELKNERFIECSYSSSEEYQVFPTFTCADCGDEVADWLSRYLIGKCSTLRLGYAMNFVNSLKMYWQSWSGCHFTFVGNLWNGHSLGPFISMMPHNPSAIKTWETLTKETTLGIEDSYGMVYPTITISVSNDYLQRKWEWIKIGDLIINGSKSAIVKGSNRAFDKNMKLFGLGVNCKLYQPGYVKLNDDVYFHFP